MFEKYFQFDQFVLYFSVNWISSKNVIHQCVIYFLYSSKKSISIDTQAFSIEIAEHSCLWLHSILIKVFFIQISNFILKIDIVHNIWSKIMIQIIQKVKISPFRKTNTAWVKVEEIGYFRLSVSSFMCLGEELVVYTFKSTSSS